MASSGASRHDDPSPTDATPRLHVYLALRAPLGVVLRRGPSDWARLSLWHTDTDELEHGQWLHARVFPRRCDVSPDGSLFTFFAYGGAGLRDLGQDSWMAVSRPPWFTALAVWGVGGTYWAGGFFRSEEPAGLCGVSDGPDRGELPRWLPLTPFPYMDPTTEWTERTVYLNRLLRDGWSADPEPADPAATWTRVQPGGDRVLVQRARPFTSFHAPDARYRSEYLLQDGDRVAPLERVDWADWDQRGRLTLTRGGRLLSLNAAGAEQEIADFRSQRPDPQPAPPAASDWPRAPAG